MFRVLALALLASASAFHTIAPVRVAGRALEMAKKSVGDLTEADLRGKRYVRISVPIRACITILLVECLFVAT